MSVQNRRKYDFDFYTPEQLESLLTVIVEEPNQQVANLMKMALFTGMRRGELFRLK